MSFVKRMISLTFTLNNTKFQGTGSDTLTISGLRTSVTIHEAGGVSRGACHIVVYGLTASQMNSLSLYGMPADVQFNNRVSVSAGDAVSGMSQVFQGTITSCEADYSDQENAALVVEAYAYQYQAIAPAQPYSQPGSVDVSVIMGNLAKQLGLNFENTGVSVKLSNPYLCGSLVKQVQSVAKAANINAYLDSKSGKLAIWPKGQGRNAQIVEIGPTTGLHRLSDVHVSRGPVPNSFQSEH